VPQPPDPQGILARKWASFERSVLDPISASRTQRRETRLAWYAGAATMFDVMTDLAGPDEEDDAVGAARVEVVHQELARFARDVAEGRT